MDYIWILNILFEIPSLSLLIRWSLYNLFCPYLLYSSSMVLHIGISQDHPMAYPLPEPPTRQIIQYLWGWFQYAALVECHCSSDSLRSIYLILYPLSMHWTPPCQHWARPWDWLKKKKGVINSNNISVTWLLFLLCSDISGDPMDCSPSGSSVHGIFQARILKWVVISYSRESSPLKRPGKMWNPHLLHHQVDSLPFAPPGEEGHETCPVCCMPSHSVMSSSLKPLDYSPQGPSVNGDSPGKYTEWVAMPSSSGSSQPRDQTQVSCIAGALLSETQGSPWCEELSHWKRHWCWERLKSFFQ